MITIKTYFEEDFDLLNEKAYKCGIAALARMGAFIRRSARSSIRPRKKGRASPPGTPYSRGSGFLRDSIVFNVNRTAGIVTIGSYRGGNVDEIHEFGLPARRFVSHRWQVVKYPKRPVMVPALEKAERDFARKYPRDFEKFFNKPGRAVIGG